MSTEQSYEPELVDQTRQQIRGLVSEIEGLARAQVSPEEFYQGFLHRVVAALAAIGGAVWTLDDEGRLTLAAQINLAETKLHESQEEQQRHGKLLRTFLTSGQGGLVQPRYTNVEDDSANPTDFLLVLGMLKSDQEIRGLVEIFQRTGGRAAVERGYLRFIMQMCELAEDYLKTRQLRLYSDRQAIWTQLEQFTRNAHSSLDPRTTAYTLANEGRRLIDCDRVSLAIRRGKHCKIEAVSGQETFDKRSNTVTLLGKLASVVVRAGEPLWYAGDTRDLAPQVEEAVEAYVDESHSKTVVVLPLEKPRDEEEQVEHTHEKPEYIRALIVEQINTDGIPTAMRRRIDVVAEHGSTALSNSLEHNSLFLMPVWRTLGKSKWIISARTLPKTIAIAVLVVAVILSLFLVPAAFQLHGKGTLEPKVKRDIFAPVGGIVDKLFVKGGDIVQVGQPLVDLKNSELETQYNKAMGDKLSNQAEMNMYRSNSMNRNLSAEEKSRLQGNLMVAEAKDSEFDAQLKVLAEKRKKLHITSPIAGRVTTFKLEDKVAFDRPITQGDMLMTIADPSQDWELEVKMPEDRIGHIRRAQKDLGPELGVEYKVLSDPGRTLHGTVREVGEEAEVEQEEGSIVKVMVTINKEDLTPEMLLKGGGVSAKIDCGPSSLGYAWFHDVFEFLQTKVFFKL